MAMAISHLKIQISVHLRVYSSMRVYLSSRTPHDHRSSPACVNCMGPRRPACERMTALLLRQSGRNVAISPAGLAPVAPSRRTNMFIPGEKRVSIMIPVVIKVTVVAQHPIPVIVTITVPPFDSVIPVFVLAAVAATGLR